MTAAAWYDDRGVLAAVLWHMSSTGADTSELVRAVEKPWCYTHEHDAWTAIHEHEQAHPGHECHHDWRSDGWYCVAPNTDGCGWTHGRQAAS